jgi:single-strand DNA-binding protein
MNVVCLKGNLVRDPELRYTPAGTAICNITIAKSKKWKAADGEYKEKTGFYNAFCWGARGEALSNNFHKGKEIAITGELDFDQWETEGGDKRSAIKIQINTWEFCGSRSDAVETPPVGGQGKSGFDASNKPGSAALNQPDINEEEIPF